MPSFEQQLKNQYAQVFRQSDWRLFKDVAEYHLRSAAFLKIADIKHTRHRKLMRNIRKRLYIGIACELLLKAFYLKSGYVINRTDEGKDPLAGRPYKFSDVHLADFDKYETLALNYLIQNLPKVQRFAEHETVIRGFTIAKVFRNKEGHIALASHAYNAQDYSDVEQALIEFYAEGFGERLAIQISMESKEHPQFRVDPLA